VKELEEKSSLIIQWEPIRNGRKIEALRFTFQEDEQRDLFKDDFKDQATLEVV